MAQVYCDISNENMQETKKMVARHENQLDGVGEWALKYGVSGRIAIFLSHSEGMM